jgi:hypothetical protein
MPAVSRSGARIDPEHDRVDSAGPLSHERGELAVGTHVCAVERPARCLREPARQADEIIAAAVDSIVITEMDEFVHHADDAPVVRVRESMLGHRGDLALDDRTVDVLSFECG